MMCLIVLLISHGSCTDVKLVKGYWYNQIFGTVQKRLYSRSILVEFCDKQYFRILYNYTIVSYFVKKLVNSIVNLKKLQLFSVVT